VKLRIGFGVWTQFTDWDASIGIARDLEALGFDALWSCDHFLPYVPSVDEHEATVPGPIFEGWIVLAGWAAATSRIRLGCLVSGVGYRNPSLTVKMATSLDHMSGGRVTLGIGAGWFRAEHERFGYDLLEPADRFDRFEDAAAISRGLLDGGTRPFTHEGRFYAVRDAVNDPPPVQARLPLMIAGAGERRTIPIVARYADLWNLNGDPATLARKGALLDAACRAIGRDPREVRRTAQRGPAMIRSTRDEAVAALAEVYLHNGMPWSAALAKAVGSPNVGTVEDVVAGLAAVVRAGYEEVTIELPLPADPATLEALAGPVRERLASLLA
jgi:alkanesulfonate monooxygenase SsuD/methylene tetrahydromethanopterin reductase-like flavin-dependent oxidoreductase (luciferase family)